MTFATAHSRDRRGLFILGLALIAGAVLRVRFALTDDGIFWPDEIFQTLEPAHRLVFGYGLTPWEFIDGARNWTLPALIAAVFKLATFVGGDTPRVYLTATRLCFCAVGVATAYATYLLGRSLGAQRLWAAVGAAAFALMGFAIFLSPRALSETACALPVTLGLALVLDRSSVRGRLWVGASLLGLAVLLRLHAGYFCLGALAMLWVSDRRVEARQVLVILVGWALLYGLIDKLTWGSWFHSAIVYFRFNVAKSGNYGKAPFPFYFRVLFSTLGPGAVAFLAALAIAFRRSRGWVLLVAGFVLLHSFILHKELRFLFPVFPLGCALVGLACEEAEGRLAGWRGSAVALGLAVLCLSRPGARFTWTELGIDAHPLLGPREGTDDSAVDVGGAENRLLLAASRLPVRCGLEVMTRKLYRTGGYSYLHRRVPLYGLDGPSPESGAIDYAISNLNSGGEVVAEDSGRYLIHLTAASTCTPDPHFDWHLD